jgi:hypothetical protein
VLLLEYQFDNFAKTSLDEFHICLQGAFVFDNKLDAPGLDELGDTKQSDERVLMFKCVKIASVII